MAIEIGQPAPAFSLPDTDNEQVSLESLRGNKTLLVFIPFPFTGVCTDELCELQENLGQLQELGANVVAITCDTRFSNEAWARQEGIEYPVLSDYWPHGETSMAYGVFNDSFGAAMRSTFVLNAQGIVTDMIRSEEILVARQFEDYLTALSN